MELFPELFDGLGMMKDAMIHLDIDPSVNTSCTTSKKSPSGNGAAFEG